ncbi:MAG: hypothetical protein IRZ16_07715 [Myxococcaceae bacterium]|nr:hypothetical protein [Myxococcaceae bacterium]
MYAPRSRSVHAAPVLDASFGQFFLSVAKSLDEASRDFRALPEDVRTGCAEVWTGQRPFADAPSELSRRGRGTATSSIHHESRSFDDVLWDEAVFSQLAFARVALLSSELKEFPVEAAALADVHPSKIEGWSRILVAAKWRHLRQHPDRLAQAMQLPEPDRSGALTRTWEE